MRHVILAAVVALGVAGPASACTCVWPNPPPLEYMQDCDAVFSGRIFDIDTLLYAYYPVHAYVEVEDCWKGNLSDTLTVVTDINEAVCGYPFEDDRSYLFYAWWEPLDDAYHTHLCSRTCPMPCSDVQELGPPGCGVAAARPMWGTIKHLYQQVAE